MFDKEVILEYIIRKKNEYSRQLKEYDRLKKKEEEDNASKILEQVDAKVMAFLKTENNIVSSPLKTKNMGKYIFLTYIFDIFLSNIISPNKILNYHSISTNFFHYRYKVL